MIQKTVKCKRCGGPHPLAQYKVTPYYFCPELNRFILMAKEPEHGN